MIIRQAKEKDVLQIAEILVEDWKTAYRGIMDDDFLDSLSATQRFEIEIKRYQKYIVAADEKEPNEPDNYSQQPKNNRHAHHWPGCHRDSSALDNAASSDQ